MSKDRLLAFTDGVIAIIVTVMVLDLKVPEQHTFDALVAVWPIFLSYVLSFIYIGIYWINHHHFFQLVERVDGLILWANLDLLFWLSLVPFATAWMGETSFAAAPTAVYGVALLMPALAWYAMQLALLRQHGRQSTLARAIGRRDIKGKISPVIYLAGIAAAYYDTRISWLLYLAVALMWIVPDRRIARVVVSHHESAAPTARDE
jgi:uncharacterized membrane protein